MNAFLRKYKSGLLFFKIGVGTVIMYVSDFFKSFKLLVKKYLNYGFF